MTDTFDKQLDELEAALAKATPTESQVRHEPTDYAEERFTVRGVPCGFPVATFGDHHDADLFVLMKDFLRAELPAIRELRAERDSLRAHASFLLDRLADYENGAQSTGDHEEAVREWCGHVWPAMARLKSALNPTGDAG